MGPPIDPVQASEALPQSADVVIVGGGIVGASTALFLAQQGVPTVLCEKGQIGAEQSSRNWGWCRRMGRDPRELPLIVESLNLWDQMQQLTGEDVGFRRTGISYICENQSDVVQNEAWLKSAGPYGLDSRILAGNDIDGVLPWAAKRFPAVLHTPSDGRAEPQRAAPAIARAASRAGATVLTNCAVRTIETVAGCVAGVHTERGFIAASTVVLAGGVWSGMLARTLGLRLPQLAIRSSVLRTAPLPDGPDGAAAAGIYAYRKRLDGGYTIAGGRHRHDIVPNSFRYFFDFLPALLQDLPHLSVGFGGPFFKALGDPTSWTADEVSPFEKVRILDPAPIAKETEKARRALIRDFPVFSSAVVVQHWAGMIDATPDAVPVISQVPSLPGLVISTGFSGHGFGIGPGAGRLTAEIVRGDTPVVDPTPYRYERFTDGSRPRPTVGL